VAREIRVALTPEERRRLVHTRPVDPEAHFSFLRGRFHSNRGSPADLEKALREFQAAAERDPTFAPAWAGIGWTYTWLAGAAYGVLPPRDAMPLAQAAARRALEIEPSAGAHATLGYVAERYEFDFVRAEQEFGRALELDPGSAAAHEALAEHLTKLGRFDDAIAEATTALELDPFSLTTRTNLAWRHYLARRFEEAARLARQTLSLEPAFAYSRLLLGMSLLAMGRDHEALLEFELFRSMSPGDPLGLVVVAHARARVGDTQAALELLAELEALGERRYVGADRLAWIFAGLRDTERCLASWERAFEERSPLLSHLAVSPAVDDLRSDPRFQDLVRRVGLPSADLRPSSARSNGVQAR
jgi:serine/threonine-protein kinase